MVIRLLVLGKRPGNRCGAVRLLGRVVVDHLVDGWDK